MYSNVIGVYNLNLVPKILAYTGSGGYFSDHYYFWRQDYPAITIEEDSTDLNPNMNNPNDVAANIDFDYYTENVKAAIAALAHMAQCQNTRPLLPTRTPTPSATPTPTNMPGTYSVGDYVWLDSNGDGLQNEMGTPGMDNIFMAILDSNGNLVKTTYSVGGRYYFRDLPPGQYQILFNCPQGYTFTIKSAAPYTNINSDVDSRGVATVTISTANQYDIDAGMVMLTATPTETPTITPTPTQTRTPSPTQTPSPTYTSTATPKPVYSLGNYVWVDSNANGLQDEAVEFGKDGVLIVLCDQNGVYLDYRFTAGGGFYTFANLSSATYILKFIAPTGFTFTIQNAFSNYVEYMDSDVDSAGVVTVTLGANSMDWIDAGLKALPPAIKTRVFVPNTMRGVAAAW
jgi:3',5'-cyclic AMP phosphodiesterase CpdA